MKIELSRRQLLFTTSLGALATLIPPRRAAGCDSAPRVCGATEANIEGPFYRPGAPLRVDLRDASTVGVPLLVRGRVLSLDCKTPLAGAVLDVWHADAAGRYHDAFRLRGKVKANARGEFRFRTLLPGRYLNGSTYRPAHLHVKLTAPGHRPLTTQLYFPGDPFNDSDPFIRSSLIMDVSTSPRGADASYDFVLTPRRSA